MEFNGVEELRVSLEPEAPIRAYSTFTCYGMIRFNEV
jgi:hypothetical protein